MGVREQFQLAVVVGEDQAVEASMLPVLRRVASGVTTARTAAQFRVDFSGIPALLVAPLDDPDLDTVWSAHLSSPGSCGSVLLGRGVSDPSAIARLASIGPVAHVPDPFDPARFEQIVTRSFGRATTLVHFAQLIVGQGSMITATRILRDNMFLEAMRRTLGNRMAAAELLEVDRREVQRMAKRLLPYGISLSEGILNFQK